MRPSDFHSILTAARANAAWAWERIYDEHAPRTLQYFRAQAAADPEALVGEVFVRVVRSLHTFDGDGDAFRGWLYRIAQRVLTDERRRRTDEVLSDSPPEGSVPGADEIVVRSESERRLYAMLRTLPPDQRAVVFMRVALDLSIPTIAQILGRRESAVKMLQQRAYRTLREQRFSGLPQ